jgi:anti-sigma regulatory factor (Ser/Thr protein kinase)
LAVKPRRHRKADVSLTFDVLPTLEAVPQARHAATSVLLSWGLTSICDNAVLCLTEAVTNSLIHARPCRTVTVTIHRDCRRLRVEIADADRSMTRGRNGGTGEHECAGQPREHGWGLQIVGALSSRWDADVHDTGKRVWFEMDIPVVGRSGAVP